MAVMNSRGFVIPALIGIILAVVVVVAAIVGTRQEEPTGTDQRKDTLTNFTGTAESLLNERQEVTCSVSRSDDTGSVTGTVYVAGVGRRLRGDFVLTRPDGTKANGHVILAAGNSFFWTDELPQVMKMTIAESARQANEQNVFTESLDYDCQPWKIDAKVFALPADKEVVDLTRS